MDSAPDNAPETELQQSVAETQILQWSGQRRIKYFVTGVIGPISCFAMVWAGFNARVSTLWQSGEVDTYLTLMLEPKELLPFMPLLVYSMLALGVCCCRPKLASKLWVRLGVYGGAILSTQYLIFVIFAASFFPLMSAVIIGPGLALVTLVAAKLTPQARHITIFQIMLLTTVVAVFAAGGVWLNTEGQRMHGSLEPYWTEVIGLLATCLFWMLVAAPVLNCFTYVRATFALLRSPALRSTPAADHRKLLALASGWLLGFGTSWKYSLDAMLVEYSKLPTAPPNCYISSAAAYGHASFVGISTFTEPTDYCVTGFPVNWQMCRLKFLEIALAACSPKLHRFIRRIYDFIGPRAAACCRSQVWFADASYLALKPFELLGYTVQVISGVSSRRVKDLYSVQVQSPSFETRSL